MSFRAEAVIFLSNLRGCSQQDWYRSYHTFNFGNYQKGRSGIGSIAALNDDTLKGGTTLSHQMSMDTAVLLLPLVGALNFESINGQGLLDVGEAQIIYFPEGSQICVTNPYEHELISFLQIWFRIESKQTLLSTGKHQFDLESSRNKLISLSGEELPGTRISIGKYGGRNEGTYLLKDPEKGVFAFVIEGALEVQNRLLQTRDGLWISNTTEIEFESLSQEAIVILIEDAMPSRG